VQHKVKNTEKNTNILSFYGKVKVNLSQCLTKNHAMKTITCLIKHHNTMTYWRGGGTVPRVLNLGARWE